MCTATEEIIELEKYLNDNEFSYEYDIDITYFIPVTLIIRKNKCSINVIFANEDLLEIKQQYIDELNLVITYLMNDVFNEKSSFKKQFISGITNITNYFNEIEKIKNDNRFINHIDSLIEQL